MKTHIFVLTETFQKCIKNASSMHVPGWTPYPCKGIHAPGYNHAPREPSWLLHGYLLHFAEGEFSRTKVCDWYPLAERAFNFPNMAFFRLSPNLVQKHYGNIMETFIWWQFTSHLPIESQNTCNLTLEWSWPWYNLDLIYDLDLRQVKPS